MKLKIAKWITLTAVNIVFIFTIYTLSDTKSVYAQQPTGVIPTVTSSPSGPMATVKIDKSDPDGINIRSGPGVDYEIIGKMWIKSALPVLGKSPGGNWLLIKDPSLPGSQGWVFVFNVDVTKGEIPVAEVPPTPIPKVTAAIDPTLAAQFITTPIATRLPTFTPSAPLAIPTFETFNSQAFAGIPIGLIILALLGLGLIMALFSYFTAR